MRGHTYSVYEELGFRGEIEVDDTIQVRYIYSSSGDVRHYQDRDLAGLELSGVYFARGRIEIRINEGIGDPGSVQYLYEPFYVIRWNPKDLQNFMVERRLSADDIPDEYTPHDA